VCENHKTHAVSTVPHTDRQCVSAVCRKEMTQLQAFTHKCKIQLFCVNSVVVMLYWLWFPFKHSVTNFLKLSLLVGNIKTPNMRFELVILLVSDFWTEFTLFCCSCPIWIFQIMPYQLFLDSTFKIICTFQI